MLLLMVSCSSDSNSHRVIYTQKQEINCEWSDGIPYVVWTPVSIRYHKSTLSN